jgi:hypothetical protein
VDANSVTGMLLEKDEEGIFRFKTKSSCKDDLLNFRCPILLSHSHPTVVQVIKEEQLTLWYTLLHWETEGKIRDSTKEVVENSTLQLIDIFDNF